MEGSYHYTPPIQRRAEPVPAPAPLVRSISHYLSQESLGALEKLFAVNPYTGTSQSAASLPTAYSSNYYASSGTESPCDSSLSDSSSTSAGGPTEFEFEGDVFLTGNDAPSPVEEDDASVDDDIALFMSESDLY